MNANLGDADPPAILVPTSLHPQVSWQLASGLGSRKCRSSGVISPINCSKDESLVNYCSWDFVQPCFQQMAMKNFPIPPDG